MKNIEFSDPLSHQSNLLETDRDMTKRFKEGCFYRGATQIIEGCDDPTILVTGRFDGGMHNEIRFTTNLKHRRDEMHRPIYIDYEGNEFVMAYGIMFSATQSEDE